MPYNAPFNAFYDPMNNWYNAFSIHSYDKQPISDVTRNLLYYDAFYNYLLKDIMHYSVNYGYLHNAIYIMASSKVLLKHPLC